MNLPLDERSRVIHRHVSQVRVHSWRLPAMAGPTEWFLPVPSGGRPG